MWGMPTRHRHFVNFEYTLSFASPNVIGMIKSRRMGGVCSAQGGHEKWYKILVGKSAGKRPLGIPRHRWVDNIKMDIREIVFEGVDWIHLAQNKDRWWALVNTVMDLWVT
jgi:hypothetical protein